MKRFNLKSAIIFVSAALILLGAVGGALAYVYTLTESVNNEFTPSVVACAVVEGSADPVTGSVVNTGSVKSDVKIKNTGDTEAYIRVAVIVNWANADGNKFWAVKPVKDTDYTIGFDLTGNWIDGGDGYYYYSSPVKPGDLTGILINEAKLKDGVTPPVGYDDTQYYLSVEVTASAIQSTPASAVSNKWGVTVSDGKLSK